MIEVGNKVSLLDDDFLLLLNKIMLVYTVDKNRIKQKGYKCLVGNEKAFRVKIE